MATKQGGGNGGNQRCCCCGFLFTVGLFVLIYWAIFQPHHIRATVESATLSNLTVSNSNASSVAEVSYNLAVNLNLYNPSVRVNIYYDTIDAKLRFHDAVLGPAANGTSPSEFYQRRKTSDGVKLEFDYGRPGVGVGVAADVAGELQKEMSRGVPVRLELDVDVRVRYVFRIFKLRQKPRIWCSLSIPVKAEGPGPAVGGAVASGERCKVKY
ncbi:NDR1/HIN1-like protein 3 [Miscanthus floridulus]|uniref:NDR1/HIN1-like protein 3 n=1 Tax=Miscanthus floridulus TaxID=154761 RepID=UPI003457BDF5